MIAVTMSEEQRSLTLLSLALCALDRPGFNAVCLALAEALDGATTFEEFKRLNRARFPAGRPHA